MKSVKITLLFFVVILLLLAPPASLSIASTSLANYEATFEVVTNQRKEFRDVQVTLEITYHIDKGLKKRGMKFVESQSLKNVEVTDGEGKPLKFQVSPSGERYSKIIWFFPSIGEGEQVVVVRFILPAAISNKGGRNYFRAYWVGSWVIPVDSALYRFVFPPGYAYDECSVYPQYKYEERVVQEKKQIEISIAPLKKESFALAFSPVFMEGEATEKADNKSDGIGKAETGLEKRDHNIVERVRCGVHDTSSRVVFDLKKKADYRVVSAPAENLITIFFENCTLGSRAKGKKYSDALVRKLVLNESPGKGVTATIGLTELKSTFTHSGVNDPPRVVLNIIPGKGGAGGREESLKMPDEGGQKTAITENAVTQIAPAAPEEKIEEDIKDEQEKESVKGEVRALQEARITEEAKRVLSASTTTTTGKVAHERKLEKQIAGEDEKRIYHSARELFQQERYKETLSNLRYFMDCYPRSELAGPVSFLIGECYFRLAKEGDVRSYQPAIDAFELALALYPDSKEAPEGLLQLANSYREMGYYYEAEGNYEILLYKYPDARCMPDAFFWMAENYFHNDEPVEAKDKFQNFIARYPNGDPLKLKRASFRIADCDAAMKNYGRAQKSYEDALDRWPACSGLFPETLFYMGLTYFKNGEYDKALSLFFTALNVFPEQEYNHILLTKIGDAYQKLGEVGEALKVYAQNSVLYPESEGALISEVKMADIGVKNPGFFKFDQYLEPLLVYEKIIKKYPTTELAEEALYKQGFAFSEQKRYQEAITSLMKVLQEYTDSDLSKKCASSLQEILCRLVDSYFADKKYYFILELYRNYKEPYFAECTNTLTFFQIGESLRQTGCYDESLEMYKKAQRIYPRKHPEDELILRMGEVYLLKKEYAQAEEMFKKMISKFPRSRFCNHASHALADTYYEQERYRDARLAYLSALEGEQKASRKIRGCFYLGKCYQAAGNYSLAIDAYRSAIQVAEELERDQVEQEFIIKSYFQLADCLYQNQQYMNAVGVYTQMVERYPEDDRTKWALYRIATSYRKMGNDKVDIESLKELAASGGNDTFWEKVVSGGIRNLEWEVKNRENLVP